MINHDIIRKSFEKALSLHSSDPQQACNIYTHLVKNYKHLYSYVNLASILRANANYSDAKKVLLEGLDKYSDAHQLWHSLSLVECDLDDFPASYRSILRAISLKAVAIDYRLTFAHVLCSFKFYNLAFISTRSYITNTILCGGSFSPLHQLKLLTSLATSLNGILEEQDGGTTYEHIQDCVLSSISDLSEFSDRALRIKCLLFLTQFTGLNSSPDDALQLLNTLNVEMRKSTKDIFDNYIQSYHNLCWNLGITIIKKGRHLEGWPLYEHGLQVPAPRPQRWQRALKKPFSHSVVPLWNNQKDINLLVLGEQAVGDTMMFLLLCNCLDNVNYSILVHDRLLPIYQRSFKDIPIYSNSDIDKVKSISFDYQIPCGSLPKFFIKQSSDLQLLLPNLKSNPSVTSDFRDKYSSDGKLLVGFSWRGGAAPKRIPKKSTNLEFFLPFLLDPRYKFICLQYGDVASEISAFNSKYKTDIVFDPSVDSLKNMDTWLSQVDSLDCVVSIANTTVHGAGCLGKPLCVLVSDESDWRWTDREIDAQACWYRNTHLLHQNGTGQWNQNDVKCWLENIHASIKQ